METEVTKEVTNLPWVKSGGRAKGVYGKALKAGLRSASNWFKLGLTLYDGEFYDEAFEAFKRTQELGDEPFYVFAALVWQGHVLDLLGRREEALKFYQKAMEIEFKGEIRHGQYGMVLNEEWVEERLKSAFQRVD